MATDDRTATRQYLLPNPSNKLKDDVERLRSALSSVDADVTALLLAMALKANLEHVHDIEDVTGLQDVLDDKLSATNFSLDLDNLADVNAPSPAGNQVLMRVGSYWIPATIQVNHVSGLEGVVTDLTDAMATRWNATVVAAAPSKATPVDTDIIPLIDSVLKKFTWANLKATLKTYMDTLYSAVGHTHAWSAITGKPSTIGGYGITDAYTSAQANALVNGNMGGRAFPKRNDGTYWDLTWSDPGGQSTYLLGSNDGVTVRPYAIGGLSVNYASSAGSANNVGGWTQPTISAQIESRAQAWANTRAPYDTGYNGVGSFCLQQNNSSGQWAMGGGYALSGLSGTWRCTGQAFTGSTYIYIFQRIA